MWFFFVQGYPYKYRTKFNLDSYSLFERMLGPNEFYEPTAMTNLFGDMNTYQTSKNFALWSYKRNLEICFINILEICLLMCCLPEECNPDNNVDKYLFRTNKCLINFFFNVNQTLYFYYTIKEPLSVIKEHDIYSKSKKKDCNMVKVISSLSKYGFDEKSSDFLRSTKHYEKLEMKFQKYIFDGGYADQERKMNDWYEKQKSHYINTTKQFEFNFCYR